MKICFFNSTNVWGGGEKWHLDAAVACVNNGHDVLLAGNRQSELLTRAKRLNLRTKSFKITNLSFLNPFKLLTVSSFLKKEQFDVIILNFSKDLKLAAPGARLAKIPRIIYRRGLAVPIKNTFLNRLLFKNCLDDILVNSLATKKSILQNNPNIFPENKITVIYNGIEFEQFLPYQIENSNNTTTNPVILSLGRCVFQKGQDLLIKIAAILKQRGINCQIKIGGDGALLPTLKKQAEELGVSDMIEFVGFVTDSPEFLTKWGGGIFVLTSRWEGFGYVLAEAMACQLPIVAFNVSSNPELIFDGDNGYLVEPYDLEAFADKLQTLIQNPQLQVALGQRGRRLAEEKFEAKKNMQQILTYITK